MKGVIDLSDIESINQGLSQQQHPQQQHPSKKALNTINLMTGGTVANSIGLGIDVEPKSCFEVRTSKRVYVFCASSSQDAVKWVKQLEACCLDS